MEAELKVNFIENRKGNRRLNISNLMIKVKIV